MLYSQILICIKYDFPHLSLSIYNLYQIFLTHTIYSQNVEQVWVAEQQDAKEKKKIAEFEKQIKEERQIQELRELQASNGNAVKMVDNSLDWMYEGPSGSAAMQAESSEEYLLGKIFKGKDPNQANAAAVVAPNGSDPTWMRKVASKNDAFTRVHEDPILFIKQQEKLVSAVS